MSDQPKTTNPSKDYLLGFHAAIKAALNAAGATYRPEEDSRDTFDLIPHHGLGSITCRRGEADAGPCSHRASLVAIAPASITESHGKPLAISAQPSCRLAALAPHVVIGIVTAAVRGVVRRVCVFFHGLGLLRGLFG